MQQAFVLGTPKISNSLDLKKAALFSIPHPTPYPTAGSADMIHGKQQHVLKT